MKEHIRLLVLVVTSTLLAVLPTVQGVSPPPDGGYPGGNTAEGQDALFGLTTGTYNTAVGFFSLRSDTQGQFNTAVGAGTLLFNLSDQKFAGIENTAVGAAALLFNTRGTDNTALGAFALYSNTLGGENTAVGNGALYSNTYGSSNCAFGPGAMSRNTTGDGNVAVGSNALFYNTEGYNNIAIGEQSLLINAEGDNNIAFGFWALRSIINSSENVVIGDEALSSATGNNNIAIGAFAGNNVAAANNVICIGSIGAPVDDSCFIGHIRGVTTQNNDAMPVVIDSAGQLGTAISSRRYKTDINTIADGSESILALRPVSFRYKAHKDRTPQFGLVAEEVAAVNPDLVIYDGDGKPYTVRYEAVNAMLLNEFLKEHKKVEEQQVTIAELKSAVAQQQKHIEALTAGLRKVSEQVELSKSAPQTVLNDR